jgi:hypothetical protein
MLPRLDGAVDRRTSLVCWPAADMLWAMQSLPCLRVCLALAALPFVPLVRAADLTTVSVEHLYYLEARAERVRTMKPEEMVEYCLAQKIGGASFDNLYAQLLAMRLEINKLQQVEGVKPDDPRIVLLNKTHEELSKVLDDEVRRVQRGLVREGQIATDALRSIATAQNPQ